MPGRRQICDPYAAFRVDVGESAAKRADGHSLRAVSASGAQAANDSTQDSDGHGDQQTARVSEALATKDADLH
jgi:hypothetical protein